MKRIYSIYRPNSALANSFSWRSAKAEAGFDHIATSQRPFDRLADGCRIAKKKGLQAFLPAALHGHLQGPLVEHEIGAARYEI